MAQAPEVGINALSDDLLIKIFGLLPPWRSGAWTWTPHGPDSDRHTVSRVSRRWAGLATSPAAAPLWEELRLEVCGGHPARTLAQLAWLAAHHARARELRLGISDHGFSWHAALPALAMVGPRLERLVLSSSIPPPERAGWLRHLGPGLTHLAMDGVHEAALGRALARGGAAALLELELHGLAPWDYDGPPPVAHGPLPAGLSALSRLTRLKIRGEGGAAPPDDEYWRALGGLAPSLERLELEYHDGGYVPSVLRLLTALTALTLPIALEGASVPQGPADSLGALRELPRLARLEYHQESVPSPSAVTALAALRELRVRVEDELAPAVEAGAHLGRLKRLEIHSEWNGLPPRPVDARRHLVEPLRGATALTSLAILTDQFTLASALLSTARVDELLAGKPALRRLELQKEHALERDFDLAALRARHPAVEFVLSGWWAPPYDAC